MIDPKKIDEVLNFMAKLDKGSGINYITTEEYICKNWFDNNEEFKSCRDYMIDNGLIEKLASRKIKLTTNGHQVVISGGYEKFLQGAENKCKKEETARKEKEKAEKEDKQQEKLEKKKDRRWMIIAPLVILIIERVLNFFDKSPIDLLGR